MFCGGGNCACECGNVCGGCKTFPDMSYTEQTSTTASVVMGVAPVRAQFEGAEMGVDAENGCKCGPDCTCNPCTCM